MTARARGSWTFLLCGALKTIKQKEERLLHSPVTLKLCADDAGARAPEVVADDPITLVLEHAFVERLDVASMSG